MATYFVSDDKSLLDIDCIHEFLSASYWAKNIPIETLNKAIENSLCFGVYTNNNQQVGFARAITDRATFAYLADVFILKQYRGQGLSKQLIEYVKSHPELQGLRRTVLVTADAHELYRQYGFTELNKPSGYMEQWQPNIYQPLTVTA